MNNQNNSWMEIAKCYRHHFKKDVDMWQVHLWWFGQRRAAYKGAAAKKTEDKFMHRKKVEHEVAPWDVVIRLAIKYVHYQLSNRKIDRKLFFIDGQFSYEKLNSFLYFLIWSPFARLKEMTRKADGAAFMAQTFWGWAIEHKNDYSPVLSKSGMKGIREIMRMIGNNAG